MPIITLTTDLGDSDHFVGALKGYLLSHSPSAQVVDITHKITPFHIAEAAYVLRNAYREYLPGTIHLASVDLAARGTRRNLLIESGGHVFVGPDNGLFSLVLDGPIDAFGVDEASPTSFSAIDHLAPLACAVANGKAPREVGSRIEAIAQLSPFRPGVSPEGLRCNVVHIDHYGNAVLNLSAKTFAEARQERNFVIYLRGGGALTRISPTYHEVPEGEAVCFFNREGFLEIAVNAGRADGLLALKRGESVRIDFE